MQNGKTLSVQVVSQNEAILLANFLRALDGFVEHGGSLSGALGVLSILESEMQGRARGLALTAAKSASSPVAVARIAPEG